MVASAVLSDRYISDRFLPDKAIDLIDEAASKLRIEIDSLPEELDEIERKIQKLEVEQFALKKEKDDKSVNRIKEVSKEIANAKVKRDELKSHWQLEKASIKKIREIKENLDQMKIEIEKKERDGDLNKVAELQYGSLPSLENELQVENKKLTEIQ